LKLLNQLHKIFIQPFYIKNLNQFLINNFVKLFRPRVFNASFIQELFTKAIFFYALYNIIEIFNKDYYSRFNINDPYGLIDRLDIEKVTHLDYVNQTEALRNIDPGV